MTTGDQAATPGALPVPILKVGIVMSLALLGDALLYVALPNNAAALGLPLWSVGILLGTNRIVRLFTNGFAAWTFERIGARGPVIAATIGSMISTAAYGLLPWFWPLFVARMAWGTCFSTVRLGAYHVVLHASTPSTRGRLVGTYQSLSRAGPVVALVGGGLLVEWSGFHTTFVVLAVLTGLALPLALSIPSKAYGALTDTSKRREPGAWHARWFGGRRLVAVKFSILASGFTSQGMLTPTVALALSEVAGLTDDVVPIAGALVAARSLSDLALAPAFGALSDRIGRYRAMLGALIASSAAMLMLAGAQSLVLVIVGVAAEFAIATALGATGASAAGDLAPPDRRSEVMSSYADWSDLGAALGPPLAFALLDLIGLRACYAISAVVMFAAAAQFVLAWRQQSEIATAAPAASSAAERRDPRT